MFRHLVYLILKVLAWEICNMKLEFAKKAIIQSQLQFTYNVWFEFLWMRLYNSTTNFSNADSSQKSSITTIADSESPKLQRLAKSGLYINPSDALKFFSTQVNFHQYAKGGLISKSFSLWLTSPENKNGCQISPLSIISSGG